MLTILMDSVYISGSQPSAVLSTELCNTLEIDPLPATYPVASLPKETELVIYELTHLDDLFRLESWLVEPRNYALVIVVSIALSELLIKALEAGADDYIVDPNQNLQLATLVLRRAVTRKQALEQNVLNSLELEQRNIALGARLELLKQDQKAGRYVQQKILPETPWVYNKQILTHHICPSLYLSGDVVDYFPVSDGQVMFYLADVSGHGASSAFITILLKVYIRRYAKKALERNSAINPADVLSYINNELLETGLGKHLTIFLGLLDTKNDKLRYCNGAHFPYPVLFDEQDGARYLEGKSMPVGLFSDAAYEEFELLLHPRYHLILFSDGIFEVINETSLADKEKRLLEIAVQFAGQHDAMVEYFTQLGMHDAPDDVSLLAVSGS